jgi:hypothetical protein
MAPDEIEKHILDRFSLKTAKTKGGLSATMIRGAARGPLRDVPPHEIDAALIRLRKSGVLAYTQGLWWKR